MRHTIPLAILTAAVIGGLYLAVNAHHNYTHQLTVKNAQAAAARAKTALRVQAQAQSTAKKLQVANTDITLLVAQCKQGQAAYNQLTAYQKRLVKAPYCSYDIVK